MTKLEKAREKIDSLIDVIKDYSEDTWKDSKEALSTLKDALEKQIPKKPIWDMGWVCPNCKNHDVLHFPKRSDWDDLYCGKCGQALDWSDSE